MVPGHCRDGPDAGSHHAATPGKPLDRLAKPASIWERRISILATHWFIRHDDFADPRRLAEKLLTDTEDLIDQAGGW
ncbi:MAG: DNA alkylation repair protein, partial [Planctomycetota bacterium]|nr:DNA alkylation repair protein [Planctomycetota bacterium]